MIVIFPFAGIHLDAGCFPAAPPPLEEGNKAGTIHTEEVGTALVVSLEGGIGLMVVGNGLEAKDIGAMGSLKGVDIDLKGTMS